MAHNDKSKYANSITIDLNNHPKPNHNPQRPTKPGVTPLLGYGPTTQYTWETVSCGGLVGPGRHHRFTPGKDSLKKKTEDRKQATNKEKLPTPKHKN